ncbi:uncharacterized protein LOC134460255 isoform X2 [Engraulis encrasicolus]|uniref:uncharacterized protein LOC134460255 isoform X2 n=1 Tax=Engraulis encrasicolus TaxID=184585 RepID=UPI002FD4AD02
MEEQNWCTLSILCGRGTKGYHYTVEKIQYSKKTELREGDKLVKLNGEPLSKYSPEEFCDRLPMSGGQGQRECVAWEVEQNQGTEQYNEHGSASARCPMRSSFDVTIIVMLCDAEMTVFHADNDTVSVETCFYNVISCICKAVQVLHCGTYLGLTPEGPGFQNTNSEITMLTLRTEKGEDFVGFRFPGDCFLKCGENGEIDAMVDR